MVHYFLDTQLNQPSPGPLVFFWQEGFLWHSGRQGKLYTEICPGHLYHFQKEREGRKEFNNTFYCIFFFFLDLAIFLIFVFNPLRTTLFSVPQGPGGEGGGWIPSPLRLVGRILYMHILLLNFF